jgi:hypothetical protein
MTAAPSRVIEIDRYDHRWGPFVADHPKGLIYHHPAWLEVLGREYGQSFTTLASVDQDGGLRGLLPLCSTRGLPLRLGGARTGPRLSSLPRTPIAGPLAHDMASARALVEAALERARSQPGVVLELKPPVDSAPPNGDGLGSVPWNRTYVLELPGDAGDLRFGSSRSHGAIKRAVNKATRGGVTVRTAEKESELRNWYRLYLETMRVHVHPPRPYTFFQAMWDVLRPRGMMRLLLAEQVGEGPSRLLAGSIFFMFGQSVVYGFNGRLESGLAVRPNDLLHWHAIHEATKDGFRFYDLGEVSDSQEGLARYKAKWGATPNRLSRLYFPAERAPHGGGEATGLLGQLADRVWGRLPLGTTAAIGRVLYRYL